MSDLVVREYGSGSQQVVVLHGGPAAVGDVAALAEKLGKRWRVLEPFQRGSGADSPLTVTTHVRDLHDLILDRCDGYRPVLVGHSWGAMLALAYAAEHPGGAAGLVLVGCGTFSKAAREEFATRLDARLTRADRACIESLERTETDPDRRLGALGQLMRRVFGYDVEPDRSAADAIDSRAHEQTWADMMSLQREGTYPAAFATIHLPVLMIHGDADPHPGTCIQEDLRRYIPQLEYQELVRCGHSPWLERQARQRFFEVLEAWLAERFADESLWSSYFLPSIE